MSERIPISWMKKYAKDHPSGTVDTMIQTWRKEQEDFDIIRKFLRKTDVAVNMDCLMFNKYVNGEIDLKECRDRFFYNNNIKNEEHKEMIPLEVFKKWIETLGYRRAEC